MITHLVILVFVSRVYGITLGLCSTVNVGSNQISSQFMSNGLCHNHCQSAGTNYGIVQRSQCWCSDSLPGSSVDMSKCQVDCPGFPSDNCATTGFYGYLDINDPSNSDIAISSSSSSSSNIASKTSSPSSRSSSTVILSSSTTNSISASSSTASTLVSSSNSQSLSTGDQSSDIEVTSSETEIGSTFTPTTVVSIMTVDGTQVSTEFVTAAPSSTQENSTPSSSALGSPTNRNNSFFDSTGKVAGTFSAVGVVVVALIGGILYCCCCLKKNNHDDYSDEEQFSSDESVSAKTPNLDSKFDPPSNQILKSPSQPHSASHSLKRDNSNKSIFSLLGKDSTISRSLSKKKLTSNTNNTIVNNEDFEGLQMFPITELDSRRHDSRLEPMFLNQNASNQTLNDDIDYSRKLKIINPDQ